MYNLGKQSFQKIENLLVKFPKGIFYVVLFMMLIISICLFRQKYKEWKENHTGIPDVIGSISENNVHYLLVVANRDKVEDKEELSRKIHLKQ